MGAWYPGRCPGLRTCWAFSPRRAADRAFPHNLHLLNILILNPHFPYFSHSLKELIYSRPRVMLLAAAGSTARGREQHYLRPRVDNLLSRFSKLPSNGKCTSTVPRLSHQIADFGAAKQKLRLAHVVFTVKMLPLPVETDNKQKNTKNERYHLSHFRQTRSLSSRFSGTQHAHR